MKIIKIIFIFFCLANATALSAQNWAGPDTSICQGVGATLGLASTPDDYCFNWEPTDGLDNSFAKQPIAHPNKTTEYTLVAIGPGFNNKVVDKVKVTVSTGGVVLSPTYTEPDGTVNQAHAHLTSKQPGTTIIWSIQGANHGCVINPSTGNISYCNSFGDVKIRATVSGSPQCYAEGAFRVNAGVKEVYAIDVAHPTRKATNNDTLHLVGENAVKLKAIVNDGETFGEDQPSWEGSSVMPPDPNAHEWVHDAGTPTSMTIEAGHKKVYVQRHTAGQVSAGGFSHTMVTIFNALKSFLKPPDEVQKGHKFSDTQTSACSPFKSEFSHNVTYKYAPVEKFNSPDVGSSHSLEGEISATVTAKICFPPPYSSVPNPVFVWSTYLVASGSGTLSLGFAKDESKAVPAKWKVSTPPTMTSAFKLGVGGEVGLLLPGDIFGVQGSVFGGVGAQANTSVDFDSLSFGMKIEPLYIEGGLKVWYLNPSNLILELKGKYNMLDPIAIKPRAVIKFADY